MRWLQEPFVSKNLQHCFLFLMHKPPCGCPRMPNQIKKYTAELTGFLFCLFCRKAAVWLLLLRDLKISAVLVLYPPAMTETSTKWTNSILAGGRVPALLSCCFSVELLKEGKCFSRLQEAVSSGATWCSPCLGVLH